MGYLAINPPGILSVAGLEQKIQPLQTRIVRKDAQAESDRVGCGASIP